MASCQLGRHYTRPELNLPECLSKTQQSDTLTIADMQWWEIYTDTTLQQLINKTLDHNKDLLIAAARVKELAAMKRIDWANLFPRIDAKGLIEKEGSNYGGNNYKNSTEQHAKFVASWELDLWRQPPLGQRQEHGAVLRKHRSTACLEDERHLGSGSSVFRAGSPG